MPLTDEQKTIRAEKRLMTNALKEEARALRNETRRLEWRDQGMYLTREHATAGEVCRGCGLPVIDNLGDWPPTMYLSAEDRNVYDAEQARYREMHPSCDAHRWTMQGSRTAHCGYCCPPLPMSPEQSERIGRMLASFPERRVEELDVWERTLTCGDTAQQSVHHTNRSPSFPTQWCASCEMTRGVLASTKIIEASARMAEAKRNRENALSQAQQKLVKAEKAAAEARRALATLRAESP